MVRVGRASTLVTRIRIASSKAWGEPLRAGALALVACAACAALAPDFASAAPAIIPTLTPPAPANPAMPPPDDGLSGGGFYIEADELTQSDTTSLVDARGHVEARYEGRTVRADEVIYNSATGVVTAKGHVVIINIDGTAEFFQQATLDKDLSQGVALAFSSRLQDNIQIAAGSIHRESPLYAELTNVIFTPCPVCAKAPVPTWSLRARKAIEDKKRQIIYFRDVIVEVHGIPVFYTPVFWQADPSVPRKSGLLLPSITTSQGRGFSWQQPYLLVVSPSEDVVFSPQFDTNVNPFLEVDWRKRFYSGQMEFRAGYTYAPDFGSNGAKLGDTTSRSYVLGNGQFNLNQNWQWGFTAERTSDPLIFDKYAVDNPFADYGLYSADDRRLISQLYGVRQDQESYFSIAAISIQGLRADDVNSTFPTIAPLIEAHYEPDEAILGGRLHIDASGVVLTRDRSPENVDEPGINSRRATLQVNWMRPFILPLGIRIDPFFDLRGDLYSLSNLQPPYAPNATIVRDIPTAGFNLVWPFFKRQGSVTYIVEPIAQLALSPVVPQDPRIPIEDSVDFEFDSTNLFQVDKSPGFDLVDSGQRLTVGGQATAQLDDGRNFGVIAGRVFRAQPDPDLPERTGLSTTSSDWIFGAGAIPLKGIAIFARARLGSDTFAINRLEIGAAFNTARFTGEVSYLDEAQDPSGAAVKDIDFSGVFFVTQHWGVAAYGAREFEAGVWRSRDVGIVYRDDCIRVEVVYRQDETFNRTWGPSNGVNVTLTLATLGNSGYTANPSTPSP